jgi:hypothetical protein
MNYADEVFKLVAKHANTQKYGNRVVLQYMKQQNPYTYEVMMRLQPMFSTGGMGKEYYACMWVMTDPRAPAIHLQVNEMVNYLVDSWDKYCNSLVEKERGAVSDSPPFNPTANP